VFYCIILKINDGDTMANKTITVDDCYTMAQAEEVTGFSRSTILKLILDDKLSSHSQAGRPRRVWFLKTDIDKLKEVEKDN